MKKKKKRLAIIVVTVLAMVSTACGASVKDGEGIYWIDYLSGSDSLRKMIEERKTVEEIKASWQADIQAFKEQRKPYLLYE